MKTDDTGTLRQFETGATRDTAKGKLDPEGFISPIVLRAYCLYMNFHRKQSDGNLRDSDNWQKGMPKNQYMKSLWRHFLDVWLNHRGFNEFIKENMVFALCGVLFNVNGYLHELLKDDPNLADRAVEEMEKQRNDSNS